MSDTAVQESATATEIEETTTASAPLVVEDLLVEDVSIDGMCGVY